MYSLEFKAVFTLEARIAPNLNTVQVVYQIFRRQAWWVVRMKLLPLVRSSGVATG